MGAPRGAWQTIRYRPMRRSPCSSAVTVTREICRPHRDSENHAKERRSRHAAGKQRRRSSAYEKLVNTLFQHPLQVVLDCSPLSEFLKPVWGGDDVERLLLTGTFAGAFGVSVCMLLIWRLVLAPAIPLYAGRSDSDKVFLGNSFVSLWPAFTAPVLAWACLRELAWDDVSVLMEAKADAYALRAVGISCGYMAYDTLYCLTYKQMRSPLIIGHHIRSVLAWPYCALNSRALPFVLFYIITEVTNIGQHSRMILLKLGLEEFVIYSIIGVSWVIMFFTVRIAPSPYLFYHLVNGNYASFTTGEFWCVACLCPLPFVLNSYW